MDRATRQFIEAAVKRLDEALDEHGDISNEARDKVKKARELLKEAIKN